MSNNFTKTKTDFGEIIEACVNRNLKSLDIQWYEKVRYV